MTELSGRPRSCRWRGDAPSEGTILRARRSWYVVMAVRSTRSDDYPHNVTLGPIAFETARTLYFDGAKLQVFAWDRHKVKRRRR